MNRRTLMFLAMLCACSSACGAESAPASASATDEAASSTTELTPEGWIRVSESARGFLHVETVATGRDVAVLHAPSRVAYRDGSVAQIGSPVSGRVADLSVRVGDVVAEGQPLVTIRSPDAAAMRAELSTTSAALEHALAEARRTADMLEHGVASDRERREADLRVSELEIQLARARTQVSLLGRGAGGSVVLRAPIAGTVLTRRASIGMSVEPNMDSPLVEIGDPATLGVIADVFDRDAALVRIGAPAQVTLPSIDAPLPGHVAYVAPIVTSGLRTVQVRIELDQTSDRLRPGLFGRAAITMLDSGVVVPSSAVLVRDGDHTIVYVEEQPGAFRQAPIEVGPSVDGHVHVVSGLEPGQRVVVEGALLLDGAADQLI